MLEDIIRKYAASKKEKLIGGKGDFKPDSSFNPYQLKMGIKHEKEHTPKKEIAKEIAKDHLTENPKYYTELNKFEKDASESDKDLQEYHAWKQTGDSKHLNNLMTRLQPLIQGEAYKWRPSGKDPKLLESHANTLAFDAIMSYKPGVSQLNTHITNNLKKMSRFVIENQNAVRVPEEKLFQYRKFLKARDEFVSQTGREPTPEELKDKLGFGDKIGDFQPMIEKFYAKESESGGNITKEELSPDAIAIKTFRNTLNDKQLLIFDKSYGYDGTKPWPNHQIAKHLGVSAPAISKQKKQLDKGLDEHIEAIRSIMR